MSVPLIAILCSLTAFLLIVVLFAAAGREADLRQSRIESSVEKEKAQMYEDLEQSFYKRFVKPAISTITRRLTDLMPKKKNQPANPLEKTLRQAGIGLSVQEFTVIKFIIMFVVLTITLILSFVFVSDTMVRLLVIAVGMLAAVMGPTMYVRQRTSARTLSIKNQLPEVMDVLMVSVEAGLGLDEAIVRLSERMHGVLIDELVMLHRSVQMGQTRREAFAKLADCAEIQELKVFCSAIVQAEVLGIPIKNVLTVQAAAMRDSRRQAAQEKGQKAPVKMIIPMVLFILPVLLIVLLAPVVLQLIEEFS